MKIKRPESVQPIPAHAKKVFKGIVFDVYQWEQKLYDGRTVTFEKVQRPDTVVVFPVLPDGTIMLARQEQPGRKPYISALGGRVNNNEDVLVAAQRELREETGYEAEQFELWKAEQPSSKVEWAIYIFIAKKLKKETDIHLDGGEKIEIWPVTFDQLLDLAHEKNFIEKEITPDLLEAKLSKDKYAELKQLFSL